MLFNIGYIYKTVLRKNVGQCLTVKKNMPVTIRDDLVENIYALL